MQLYNTASHRKETFTPQNVQQVTMYCCGPTVYNFAHIGNLRTYIFEDLLARTIRLQYPLKHVMNVTDVGHLVSDADDGEDKMELGAAREGKSAWDIAKFYEEKFWQDYDALHCTRPTIISRATAHIPEMIALVKTLEEKGYTYRTSDGIYYDTSKFPRYDALVGHARISGLQGGARVEMSDEKRNPTDFALWKFSPKDKKRQMEWDSPWGVGFPGWHMECSAMAMKYLGHTLDIHCGGIDNMFPHHTNEIAQSESYLGHKWCPYWLHVQHLNDRQGKMSKSKGDFLTVSLLVKKGYNPLAYRMFCLQSHYRKPLEFSYEILDNTVAAYNKLVKRIAGLKADGAVDEAVFAEYKAKFEDALCNDMNTSMAITVLYDLLKAETNDATKLALVKDFDQVLSLDLTVAPAEEPKAEVDAELEAFVLAKIEERKEAKKAKDFAKADAIRDELLAKGVVIKDTREGVVWHVEA